MLTQYQGPGASATPGKVPDGPREALVHISRCISLVTTKSTVMMGITQSATSTRGPSFLRAPV